MNKRTLLVVWVFILIVCLQLHMVSPVSAMLGQQVESAGLNNHSLDGESDDFDLNISLSETSTLSGAVYDAGIVDGDLHGYPLYASLTFVGQDFDQTIYSNPFDGSYEIELNIGQEYAVTVSAVIVGYEPYTGQLTPSAATSTQDFYLHVESTFCTAPGYSGGAFLEDFEAGVLPVGWDNVDYAGTGQVWDFYTNGLLDNLTPGDGGFAVLDSDYYGVEGYQDAGLRTPVRDFSSAETVSLNFDTHFESYDATAQVRVSVNNGIDWTTVALWTEDYKSAHVSLDLSEIAAGYTQVMIEFRYTGTPGSWGFYWQVDNVLIQAGECRSVNGGVAAGYVIDENTLNPLIGANVVSPTLATHTIGLPNDPENAGLYWAFQPTVNDPEDVAFTASMPEYDADSSIVTVYQDAVTRQDFSLGAGYLVFDPMEFTVNRMMGDDPVQETLSLSNVGTQPVSFELNQLNRGVVSSSTPAFAIDATNENLVYLPDAATPGTWDIIGSLLDTGFSAGDFIGGDFTTLYAADAYLNKLYSIDTATGTSIEIGAIKPVGEWTGLTGTPDGTLYGLSSNCGQSTNLLIVDPDTAATTNLGVLPGINCGIDLAFNTDDEMIYIVDVWTNDLFRVNPETMSVTMVGMLDIDTYNYHQGLDYEEESGVLYWAAYNATDDRGELRSIDTATGASELIGPFQNGENVTVLAFATGGPVGWLSVSPESGTLDPGNDAIINITFDPSGLEDAGTYQAELSIKHDTLYTYANIPVTLNFNMVSEPVNAGFSGNPTTGVSPLQVSFTNASSGDYDTCAWDFGDGETSTSCGNFNHTYQAAGVYTVSLTVSGLGGEDTLTQTDYITVYVPVCAGFSAAPLTGVSPLQVSFTNGSSGDYDTCSWDFGDGETSTSCGNPNHTYQSAGIYTVSLTVSGLGGEDTQTQTDYITVYVPVSAGFSAAPLTGVSPLQVSFTNESSGDYDTCTWDFGDGETSTSCGNTNHTYQSAGIYTVSLTVSGLGGEDTETKTNYINVNSSSNPVDPAFANFSATPTSGQAPLQVAYTNDSSGDYDTCAWNFGDGETSTSCSNPSHIYQSAGVYTVSLTVSGLGGENTLTLMDYITVYAPVIADFSGTPLTGVSPLQVSLTNESSGDYDTCAWDFGDGDTSMSCDNPSHIYQSAGVYSISLTVSGSGGEDTETKINYINVSSSTNPVDPVIANFSATPTSGQAPLQVTYTNESSGDYDTCAWDFGDGETSTSCGNPSHTYQAAGVYTVSLTVRGSGGEDTHSKEKYIHVQSINNRIFLPLILAQ